MHTLWTRAYVIRLLTAVAVALLLGGPAQAATIEQIEDAVQTAVQQQAVDQITTETERRVEEQVAAQVEDTTVGQVEDSVTSEVTDTASAQVEESVTTGVTEQITGMVADQAAESVVSGVGAAAEERIGNAVDDRVMGRVVEQTAGAVEGRVQTVIEGAAGAAGDLPAQAGGAVAAGLQKAQQAAGGASDETTAATGVFREAVDPQGQPIERDVLMLLVPRADLAAVRALGMDVQRVRALPGLGRVLVRLQVEPGFSLGQAAALVRQASASTTVDYNHLYKLNAESASGADAATPEAADNPGSGAYGPTVGIIDTAIETEHPALAGARIVQQDFIGAHQSRPTSHGTAIASILVQESRSLSGAAPSLYAANVFFECAPGVDTATTESIVAALAWLIERDVAVVNMSLTGPANELLQLAVGRAAAAGSHVVAAVGNNGPVGEPLYPAAYESVIGVTAVDGSEQAFVYANRGSHVMFSAPGVGVRVANSGGGFAEQDGTSLAAAHAAMIIATSLTRLAHIGQSPHDVMDELRRGARDLGPSGFDEVFGYGLIEPLDI